MQFIIGSYCTSVKITNLYFIFLQSDLKNIYYFGICVQSRDKSLSFFFFAFFFYFKRTRALNIFMIFYRCNIAVKKKIKLVRETLCKFGEDYIFKITLS